MGTKALLIKERGHPPWALRRGLSTSGARPEPSLGPPRPEEPRASDYLCTSTTAREPSDDGDYDLRCYLALDDSVRPGYSGIRYSVKVDTNAPAEILEEIRVAAERTSPMFDNIRNGAAVEARVESVG